MRSEAVEDGEVGDLVVRRRKLDFRFVVLRVSSVKARIPKR